MHSLTGGQVESSNKSQDWKICAQQQCDLQGNQSQQKHRSAGLQAAITHIVATSRYRQKGSRTATTCLLMEVKAVSQSYCKSAKSCRSSTHCTAQATVTVLQSLTAQNRNKLSCMLQRICILNPGTVYIVGISSTRYQKPLTLLMDISTPRLVPHQIYQTGNISD